MKKRNLFLSMALMCSLSSVFVSCTKDDVLDKQKTNGRTPITFISGINTRSANVDLQQTQIAEGVKVGVFVTGASALVAATNNY